MEVYNCPRCGDGAPYICQKCYEKLEDENKRLRAENNWLREGLLNILKISRKALEGGGSDDQEP